MQLTHQDMFGYFRIVSTVFAAAAIPRIVARQDPNRVGLIMSCSGPTDQWAVFPRPAVSSGLDGGGEPAVAQGIAVRADHKLELWHATAGMLCQTEWHGLEVVAASTLAVVELVMDTSPCAKKRQSSPAVQRAISELFKGSLPEEIEDIERRVTLPERYPFVPTSY